MDLDWTILDNREVFCIADGNYPIVVEFKMKVAQASNDLDLIMFWMDGAVGDWIYLWTTTYAGRWMWLYWWGTFWNGIATSWSNPSVWSYYEYRLTINWTALTWERGVTLASITNTINHTMAVSAAWKKFGLLLVSGWVSYPWGYFDWIRVKQNGYEIFFEDYTLPALDNARWEGQAAVTYPNDGSIWIGAASWGWSAYNTALTSTGMTFSSDQIGYQDKVWVFTSASTYIQDTSINNLCRTTDSSTNWTMSFFYKTNADIGVQKQIVTNASWTSWTTIIRNASDQIQTIVLNAGTTVCTSTAPWTVTSWTWQHIIVEKIWTTVNTYLNLASGTATISSPPTLTTTLQFWGQTPYEFHSNMNLWLVRCYNRILSSDEKRLLYNEGFKLLH